MGIFFSHGQKGSLVFSRKIDRKNIHTTLFPTIEVITRETTARTFSKHPVVS